MAGYAALGFCSESEKTATKESMNTILKSTRLTALLVAGAILCGCAPMTKTSKYMSASLTGPASPPPGKTLVCIHRPKYFSGNRFYVGIWDGTNFVADLGNRHSVACVCEPGQHYFMSLSPFSVPSCVEAQLLPDKTYDLWIIQAVDMRPVRQDEKMRQRVADWTLNHRWVTPASTAAGYEQAKQEKIRQLLEEFISGKRHDIRHMTAEDHR
jgi:hypothetical protein